MATPLHHNGEHTAAATHAYHGRRTHCITTVIQSVPRPPHTRSATGKTAENKPILLI